jgi:23S rRNA-/tRNA-specific pseudouridylate synthase
VWPTSTPSGAVKGARSPVSLQLKVRKLPSPKRVDRYLAEELSELSRSFIASRCKEGAVRIHPSGKKLAAGDMLFGGEELCLEFEIAPAHADGAKIATYSGEPVHIVYEDEALFVIEKPAGMPSVTLSPADPVTAADFLHSFDKTLATVTGDPRESGLIQRLDNSSSGLMIAARTPTTWAALREALKKGRIKKHYHAFVGGETNFQKQTAALYLNARSRKVSISDLERAGFERTLSVLTTEWRHRQASIVCVEAPFAKRHQVRAVLSHLGHPLVGDRDYGSELTLPDLLSPELELLPLQDFILHASWLRLEHPDSKNVLEFRSANSILSKLVGTN